MRQIDKNRLLAMNEVKVRAIALSDLAKQYERTYKDEGYSPKDKMDILDDLWKIIVDNNIRLTEVLRENGI